MSNAFNNHITTIEIIKYSTVLKNVEERENKFVRFLQSKQRIIKDSWNNKKWNGENNTTELENSELERFEWNVSQHWLVLWYHLRDALFLWKPIHESEDAKRKYTPTRKCTTPKRKKDKRVVSKRIIVYEQFQRSYLYCTLPHDHKISSKIIDLWTIERGNGTIVVNELVNWNGTEQLVIPKCESQCKCFWIKLKKSKSHTQKARQTQKSVNPNSTLLCE
jgi:hypothetical protein